MRRAVLFPVAFIWFLNVLQADAASKKEVSLEICPLDKVTFVDRVGGAFSVQKVGKSHGHICEGERGKQLLDEDGDCPYGWTVLQGQLKRDKNSESETVWAILQIMPAAPCCGWLVYRDAEKVEALQRSNFVWLDGEDVPRLKELRFSTIGFDEPISNAEAREIFGNDKSPSRCMVETTE